MVVGGASFANIAGVPFGAFIGHSFGWSSTFGEITVVGIAAVIGITWMIPDERNAKSASLLQEIWMLGKSQVILSLLGNAGAGGSRCGAGAQEHAGLDLRSCGRPGGNSLYCPQRAGCGDGAGGGRHALAGVRSVIPSDEVVKVMLGVGSAMPLKHREAAMGGRRS